MEGNLSLCCAGIEGIPWEDYSLRAKSLLTVGISEAWVDDGAFLTLIIYNSCRHLAYQPDVWHGWALGFGKEVSASSAVLVVPFFEGSCVEDQVCSMNRQSAREADFQLCHESKAGVGVVQGLPQRSLAEG